MRKRLLFAIVGLAVAGLWAAGAEAQAPRGASAVPDLSGVWALKESAHPAWVNPGAEVFGNVNTVFAFETPLTPWAQEHCEKVGCGRGTDSAGRPTGGAYLQGEDPTVIRCAPNGFPRVLLSRGLMELLQVPNRVIMHFSEYSELREIWTDGRTHPKSPNRPWMGHSIGHWEGDTLVVDTVDFHGNPKYKWLDEAGHPHSEALHVTERIRRVDQNTLQIDLRFEDPKAFTAPFAGKVIYQLRPGEEIPESVGNCEDRIFAQSPEDAWPYFVGEYPKPQYPPAGTTLSPGSKR